MDLSAVPYLILRRELDRRHVFVCICLIDHTLMGVGRTREIALENMSREAKEKYDDDAVSGFSLN